MYFERKIEKWDGFGRAMRVPTVTIDELELPPDLKNMYHIDFERLNSLVRTGKTFSSNHRLQFPKYDEHKRYPEKYMSPLGLKFVDTEVIRHAYDMFEVVLQSGRYLRRDVDYRLEMKKVEEKMSRYFMFDDGLGYYVQIDNENEHWKNTMTLRYEEKEQHAEVFYELIDVYLPWMARLQKKPEISLELIKEQIQFIELANVYLSYLLLYCDIQADECFELLKYMNMCSDRLRKVVEFFELIPRELLDPQQNEAFRKQYNIPENKLVAVESIQRQFISLLEARPEKLENHKNRQGYVSFDPNKKRVYPSLAEIERRRSLFAFHSNAAEEHLKVQRMLNS